MWGPWSEKIKDQHFRSRDQRSKITNLRVGQIPILDGQVRVRYVRGLLAPGHVSTAKDLVLWREQRSNIRDQRSKIKFTLGPGGHCEVATGLVALVYLTKYARVVLEWDNFDMAIFPALSILSFFSSFTYLQLRRDSHARRADVHWNRRGMNSSRYRSWRSRPHSAAARGLSSSRRSPRSPDRRPWRMRPDKEIIVINKDKVAIGEWQK